MILTWNSDKSLTLKVMQPLDYYGQPAQQIHTIVLSPAQVVLLRKEIESHLENSSLDTLSMPPN